jgi:hypothetical protein
MNEHTEARTLRNHHTYQKVARNQESTEKRCSGDHPSSCTSSRSGLMLNATRTSSRIEEDYTMRRGGADQVVLGEELAFFVSGSKLGSCLPHLPGCNPVGRVNPGNLMLSTVTGEAFS